MPKNHNETPEAAVEVLNTSSPAPSDRVSMSVAELAALIGRLTQEANERAAAQIASSNESLANALLESRKPYVDPRVAENDRLFREQTKEQERRKRAAIEASQKWCEHRAGSLGDVADPGHRTSIVWHQNDIHSIVGICTICQRQFHEGDEDYMKWRGQKSFNKMSRSGQDRYIPDHAKALQMAK